MLKKSTLILLLFIFLVFQPNILMGQVKRVEKPLRFGVFPYKSPKTMMKLFMPIAQRIEDSTGLAVKVVTAMDINDFIKKSIDGKYDFVYACLTCYFEIKKNTDCYPIVKMGPSFNGGMIVRNDSPYFSIGDLKGKKIAAVGKLSYGGYLFVYHKVQESGYDADEDFHFEFIKKLDSIIHLVLMGKYDAGVIRLDALDGAAYRSVKDQFRVIETSQDIPQFPIVIINDLDENTVTTIRNTFISMDASKPTDKAILDRFKVKKFYPADHQDFVNFENLLKQTSSE